VGNLQDKIKAVRAVIVRVMARRWALLRASAVLVALVLIGRWALVARDRSQCAVLGDARLLSFVPCKESGTCSSYYPVDQDDFRDLGLAECSLARKLLSLQVRLRPDENVVISPHAITLALGAVAAGARGDRLRDLLNILEFKRPAADLLWMLTAGNDLLRCAAMPSLESLSYSQATSVWLAHPLELRESFRRIVTRDLGASLESTVEPGPLGIEMSAWLDRPIDGALLTFAGASGKRDVGLTTTLAAVARWNTSTSPAQGTFTDSHGRHHVVRNAVLREWPTCLLEKDYEAVVVGVSGWADYGIVLGAPARRPDGSSSPDDIPEWGLCPWSDEILRAAGDFSSDVEVRVPLVDVHSTMDVMPLLTRIGMHDTSWASGDLGCAAETPVIPALQRTASLSNLLQAARLSLDDNGVNHPFTAQLGVRLGASWHSLEHSAEKKSVSFDRPFAVAVYHRLTGALLYVAWISSPTN